ncbi:DUF6326 family protein [Jiangella rhizosphaerae]|uniref:DUF6326 family protein n=1 Tax=Jiangella rhizosphaerae TaxID=2293569 RepID=UPI0018F68096|nr:DUF6326 family protein [Jiangella rhizosphaerae]
MATVRTAFEAYPVNARTKIAASWVTMLFVWVYVDLFSLYRTDVRSDLDEGEIGGFTVDQAFLVGTTAYVAIAIASLMVLATLILPARISRIANIVLALGYAVTVILGAVGEWGYYVLGSVIELAVLALITYHSWTWPRLSPASQSGAQ